MTVLSYLMEYTFYVYCLALVPWCVMRIVRAVRGHR